MLNNVTLQGRLTKDIDVAKTANGTSTAKFTVANDKPNARDLNAQGKPSANFITCKAYGKTAENLAKWFSKGSEIIVVGRIDTWVSEKNGEKRYGTDIIVNDFSFTSGSKTSQNGSNEAVEWDEPEPTVDVNQDDLPF